MTCNSLLIICVGCLITGMVISYIILDILYYTDVDVGKKLKKKFKMFVYYFTDYRLYKTIKLKDESEKIDKYLSETPMVCRDCIYNDTKKHVCKIGAAAHNKRQDWYLPVVEIKECEYKEEIKR